MFPFQHYKVTTAGLSAVMSAHSPAFDWPK